MKKNDIVSAWRDEDAFLNLSADERAQLVTQLRALPAGVIAGGLGVLDRTDSPRYHELTARQVDLNFLAPQRIDAVRALVAPAPSPAAEAS